MSSTGCGPTELPGKYKVVSLFSGAGGMDIGLEETGRFVTLACVEKEASFCDTLRANRDAGRFGTKELHIFERDISKLDPHEVMEACGLKPGELDLLQPVRITCYTGGYEYLRT
jgi:DNA (cytosine-5)-methyltransferase 1